MTIVTITKAPTWTDMITDLEPEEQLNAPYEKMRVITSLISGTIKLKFPERKFTTRKEEIEVKKKMVQVLVITRTA
ncbi:hypothetical protein [Pedobacter nototheniae]|uniref:hypothetical protein n=1 Tax=Pedobacter nototheniae TaxID=2488994 RepID=UPI00103DC391|nr:hypothetical protein [Pedobacter nototheniae]